MKYKILILLFVLGFKSHAQKVIPFIDLNEYLETFSDGSFKIIDFQRIRGLKSGDECAVYYDNKSDLIIYDGKEKKKLTGINVDFQVSDHLVGWKIGPTINMWDNGDLRTLTYSGIDYQVKDSIITYRDFRYNSLNVFWKDSVYTLSSVTDSITKPEFTGENLVVFKDNGNFYKIFWAGKIYDVGVWNGPISFSGGTDVVAFNDPTTRTFVIFDKGELIEVESFYAKRYKAGRGVVLFEDNQGNLKLYENNKIESLSNFATKWDIVDESYYWIENNLMKSYYNGRVIEVCNYLPKDIFIKNNVLAYTNPMGGINAIVYGKKYELTNQQNYEVEIYGNSVLIKLFNSSVVVLWKGEKYSK